MHKLRLLGFTVCTLSLSGTAHHTFAQHKGSDVESAIDARERAVEACFAKKDPACLVESFYVSDGEGPVASPPGGVAPVRGRAALTQFFQGAMQSAQALRLERVQVIVRGSMADELGRSHVTLNSGKTVTGRFSVLWLHGRDGWRAKLDFFADDGWSD